MTLMTGANSCDMSANIPGKPRAFLPYLGSGLPSFSYRTEHLDENRLCYEHFSEPFDQGL